MPLSIYARLRIVLSWSCLLLLACSSVPQVASAQSEADDTALRKMVEKFFDLYQKRDLDGLMALWSDKSTDLVTHRQEFQQSFAETRIQLKSLNIRKIEVDNNKATIRAVVEINAEDVKTGKATAGFGIINRTFHMLREGEAWKVWKYVTSEQELAAILLSAKIEEERKALLEAEKGLVTVELVQALLSEARRRYIQGAYSAALDSYGLALRLAEQLHYMIGVAGAMRGIGNVHYSQGNHSQSLEHYHKSLRISQEIGDKRGIANVLNNIGNVHYSQGDYARALEHYQRSLSVKEEIGDKQGIADILSGIGAVHYSQGDYAQALKHYQRSLSVKEEIGDKQGIAIMLGGIGAVHYSQGDYARALERYQRSLKIREEIGDKRGIADMLGNVGIIYDAQGDYARALERYQKSLKIYEEIGDKGGTANILGNIGIIHRSQGDYAQALKHYQRSLSIKEEIGDKRGIADTLSNIGIIHRSQGNYAQALKHYQRSLKIYEEIGNKGGTANILGNIGIIYDSQGDYAQALEHYQRSLSIREEIGDKRGIANALSNIGAVHYWQGDYARALERYQKSLKIYEEIGDKQGIADMLSGIGNVHYWQGDYAQARENFAGAIATVEELRGRVAGDERQQQQFFQTKLSPYHMMIRLLIDEKKPVEAFGYAERAKGRALLDTLEAGRVDVTKAMSEKERAEERRLNAEVVSLNTQVYRENLRNQPDKAILLDLKARREKARAGYEAFHINLYAAHPELKTQRGQINPISPGEAGKLILNAATAIVEYVVTEDKTYLFVLTRGQQSHVNPEPSTDAPVVNVYTINIKQKELADRVHRFHGRLTQKDLDFAKPSRELYEFLIGPAQSDLKDKSNLVIVPDDVLWQVPFQALPSSVNRFLIQDCAISYAPSLTVLREMMNVKRKRLPDAVALQTLVAFGNPDVDPTTAANLQTAYSEVLAGEKLLPLPQIESMLKTLSRLYGPDRSKVYVRAEAREDRAKKEAGTCRILQFATHGILDNTNPMYSRLVMSQSGVGEHEDGMLEAWEVMSLELNAEMVILSACDTARGLVAGGEGVVGLAWAFFVAGCPMTVVSQWPVEVNSMAELMIEFHKRLKPVIEGRSSNVSKAEALRAAVLKLMGNGRYRHPFYWAPFVVIGDSR